MIYTEILKQICRCDNQMTAIILGRVNIGKWIEKKRTKYNCSAYTLKPFCYREENLVEIHGSLNIYE